MSWATTGVYPMLTLSPTIRMFFREGSYGSGGPVLHTSSPVTLGAEPTTRGYGKGKAAFFPARRRLLLLLLLLLLPSAASHVEYTE